MKSTEQQKQEGNGPMALLKRQEWQGLVVDVSWTHR
jgi:hypothetical protein